MRISDWSSDVCSSDLPDTSGQRRLAGVPVERGHHRDRLLEPLPGRLVPVVQDAQANRLGQGQWRARQGGVVAEQVFRVGEAGDGHAVLRFGVVDAVAARSEEHTSELQSLMRISYAVFCLKKKNYKKLHALTLC